MPRLWDDTIETHRRSVRHAILSSAAALASEHGVHSVTMSQIAERAGIGRATLYKYFPDVEAILLAWHEEHVQRHLEQLTELRDRAGSPRERLEAVLNGYALIQHERSRHGDTELAAFVHRGQRLAPAQHQLTDLFRDLIAESASAGEIRDDIAPAELAAYCLHALTTAGDLRSKAAVRRVVALTTAALKPPA